MSDGPHRSLPRRTRWKECSRRADNEAFKTKEIGDALRPALAQDWRAEVSGPDVSRLRDILDSRQDTLFGGGMAERLGDLHSSILGCVLASRLIHWARYAVNHGNLSGIEALLDAAENTLKERAFSGARSVEEHYQRETTKRRAHHVRARIEDGVEQADIRGLARQLLGVDPAPSKRQPAKQQGLDDGVAL